MLLAAVLGMAQAANDTINRMVIVESTYNPIIAGAVKRNFIPEEVKPSMNRERVVYADENVDLTNFDRTAKKATPAEMTTEKNMPGYVHLGYGNYNNLNALAAYKWNINANHALALKAHTDGWNGKYRLSNNSKWHSYYYQAGLNADYGTHLGDAALNAGIHVINYNYNYLYGSSQIANDLGAYATVKGNVADRYKYRATLSYDRFNYKSLAENHFHGKVSLGMDLYEWGLVEVQINSDVLSYQGTSKHNYFSLGITPQWTYSYQDFQFITGFNMDFQNRKKHPIQLSPECSISYVPNKRFQALFTLDGGREINTFSRLHERSPYWASVEPIRPTYTFMNAHLEGGIRIIDGLHLHLGGGYKVLADALFELPLAGADGVYTGLFNHKAQVATVDGKVSYTHKDFISVGAKGTYHHWMLKSNHALLTRAPQLKVDFDTRIRIIPNLYGYTNLYLVSFTNTKTEPYERTIIDWSLGANYALNNNFSFFLDLHNLLNRRYSYYTGYPAQGFSALVGAIVKF